MKKIKILLTIAIFVVLLANDSNGVSAMEISSQCGILMEQATGRVLYEKCPDFLKFYVMYKNKQLTMVQLSKLCGVSRNTAYSYVRLIENKKS